MAPMPKQMAAMGSMATAMGHSGRRLSCSRQSSVAIMVGMSVRQSSPMATALRMMRSSTRHTSPSSSHQTWLRAAEIMKAAAQRRSRLGGWMGWER